LLPYPINILLNINTKFPFFILIPTNLIAAVLVYLFIKETKDKEIDYIDPVKNNLDFL
jgi:hypothetical protein